MTAKSAEPSELLTLCLGALRSTAQVYAANVSLQAAGVLVIAALQVAMTTLLEADARLPPDRRGEFIPAVRQLRAESQHMLMQLEAKEARNGQRN